MGFIFLCISYSITRNCNTSVLSYIKLAWQTCREKRSIRDKNQIFHSVESLLRSFHYCAVFFYCLIEKTSIHMLLSLLCVHMCTILLFLYKLHQNKTHTNLNRKKLHVVAIKVMRVTITQKNKMRWHTEDWIPCFCGIHKGYTYYVYTPTQIGPSIIVNKPFRLWYTR